MGRQKKNYAAAERALSKIAQKDGVTVDYVRRQIQLAMLSGMCNQEEGVQAIWRQMPQSGAILAPEDVIAYGVNKVKRTLI